MWTAHRLWDLAALALLLSSLSSGCLVEIRPTTYGRLVRPGGVVANVRVAICSLTPVRGWKCRSLSSTQTDADGKFEFPSASAFFPPHNMPCGERAASLVAVCHPEASQFRLHVPGESPNREPVYAFDDQLKPINGRDVRRYHSPESICKGIRLLPQLPDSDN